MPKNKTVSWGKWLLRLMVAGVVVGVAALIAAVFLYRHYVVDNPGEHISRAYIMKRIAPESPVYYRDGETKIGIFFGDEHRQYVTFDELPEDYVNAIISSEDKRFWRHPGFDILGFTRAMLGNLKNFKLIGGGSTITSQTAKNLYDRKGRSLGPKLLEVLNAFRLEAHYSKEEILEFYVNQFHVYGNGRGLGVGARYFFDKDVSELGTLECAFLAGVVKGPYLYNPFVGKTAEARERSRQRAERRVDYVLSRMAVEGYLEPERAEALKAEDIPFRQGKFRFEQNVILDYIYDQLQQEPFASLFEEVGIEDPARAGLKIVTTIDAEQQVAAEYALRHNLTELGTLLEGRAIEDFIQEAEGEIRPVRPELVTRQRFLEGRVVEQVKEGDGAPSVKVDVGGVVGVVDREGLMRLATVLLRAEQKNRWAMPKRDAAAKLVESFEVGKAVWVSVREAAHDEAPPLLDVELQGDLQGAVVVLDRGEIRAMVGGADNRNFNRVTTARRQLGSTYKSLVYTAAMSLGWKPLDVVDNRRQGFFFQRQPVYWPRYDHTPAATKMSLAWSGATSENLAAVSLLYHMTDPLTEEQRVDLARRLDMAPRPDEDAAAFKKRVRDDFGILPNDDSLREGLYQEALAHVWPDLIFGGQLIGDGWELKTLPYGRGFDAEKAVVAKGGHSTTERAARMSFLQRNFLDYEAESVRGRSKLRQVLDGQAAPAGFYKWQSDGTAWLVYSEGAPQAGWQPIKSGAEARAILTARESIPPAAPELPGSAPMDEDSAYDDPSQGGQGSAARDAVTAGRRRLLQGAVEKALGTIGVDLSLAVDPLEVMAEKLLIEGVTTPAVLDRVREEIERRFLDYEGVDRFDLRRLVRDRDFCVLMGLKYAVELARQTGVESELKPVLSMPLGSNDTTLLEGAMLYQTFLKGQIHTFGEASAQTAILKEILDVDGSVMWRSTTGFKQVLDPKVAASTGRILRSVVERGTGRGAAEAVTVTSPDPARQAEIEPFGAIVPLAGKTGTTNSYVNAAFIGFVPTAPGGGDGHAKAFAWGDAVTVAAYVGYDDNAPMKVGSIRIAGASGALPVWIDTARGVVRDLDLSRKMDLVDLAFEGGGVLPIRWPAGMTGVLVDATTGLPMELAAQPGEPPPKGAALYEVFIDPTTGKDQGRYEPIQLSGRR